MDVHIGTVIRTIREQKGLSQAQVHKLCGIDRVYISRIESGELPNLTIKTLTRLGTGLKMSASQLLAAYEEVVKNAK